MADFAERISKWRGNLSLKDAARVLDIKYQTMRQYACGKRTPTALALAMLELRMEQFTEKQSHTPNRD